MNNPYAPPPDDHGTCPVCRRNWVCWQCFRAMMTGITIGAVGCLEVQFILFVLLGW